MPVPKLVGTAGPQLCHSALEAGHDVTRNQDQSLRPAQRCSCVRGSSPFPHACGMFTSICFASPLTNRINKQPHQAASSWPWLWLACSRGWRGDLGNTCKVFYHLFYRSQVTSSWTWMGLTWRGSAGARPSPCWKTPTRRWCSKPWRWERAKPRRSRAACHPLRPRRRPPRAASGHLPGLCGWGCHGKSTDCILLLKGSGRKDLCFLATLSFGLIHCTDILIKSRLCRRLDSKYLPFVNGYVYMEK